MTFDWLSDLNPVFEAQQIWDEGDYQQSCTHHVLYETGTPFHIACGAGLLAEHVRRFRFSPEIIQKLGQVTDARGRSLLHESFLNHLQRLRLRVMVNAVPEGTLLFPGEPFMVVQGPILQIRLLSSAFRVLMWESTHQATQAALERWQQQHFEEDISFEWRSTSRSREGWHKRAGFIGGANPDEPTVAPASKAPEQILQAVVAENGQPLAQIRRLYQGDTPLGDLWLTNAQEAHASVSKTSACIRDFETSAPKHLTMNRFQNLLQPLLIKGHPVLSSPGPDYLRQRTLQQLKAFSKTGLEHYPQGWEQI